MATTGSEMRMTSPGRDHATRESCAGMGSTPKAEARSGQNVRVAMIGNVDSGKSTLVGCLTRDMIDDGRGKARSVVFRHRHEAENGRTSSVGVELMGFGKDDRVVKVEGGKGMTRQKHWQHVHERSVKSLTLIDLCGHEKYLKTTIFGLTGMLPDYGLVVVGANMGLSKMTREHLGIAAALRLPVMVVVTKVDIAPKEVMAKTMQQVMKTLKKAGRMPYLVRNEESVSTAASAVASGRIAPVVAVSSVTGENMGALRLLLRELPPRISGRSAHKAPSAPGLPMGRTLGDSGRAEGGGGEEEKEEADKKKDEEEEEEVSSGPGEVIIDSIFNVPGVGTVVAGTVLQGKIDVGETMLLGPDHTGNYKSVIVRSIHVQYTPADHASPGGSAAFAIRPKDKGIRDGRRTWVERGMALVHPSLKPIATWSFDAEILILHHQTTLSVGYAPIMHIGVVTQSAKILAIRGADGKPVDAMRTGDRAIVTCVFQYHPAYVNVGSSLLFREGRAKGVGKVLSINPEKP